MKHTWPGNVRELQNVLERAANLKSGDYIDSEDIPFFGQIIEEKVPIQQSKLSYKDKIHANEKDIIISALKEAKGNKTQASLLLGISRPWLYTKMKQYNIE
ncbi:helix-turn-helix domain-containing protein [Neobacillus pocheonensis]|uniref:helix-turn-helix domain-containing protein n=1 Tax=Neobacillus pocheonensis TaxID=363869 RepID=UPI003D29886D